MPKKHSSRFTESAIINEKTSFSVLEAFKATRTNLMFMLNSSSNKNSIVFTSYAPLDGKSTTCLNLAITFAQTGAKVLVIDADLRKPSLHRYLKCQSKPGLSDALAGLETEEPCIYKTDRENLYLLPAGTIPPNPTELLLSQKMEDILVDCTPLFDYIFIDAPPIGLVTDAAILASKTLGIINVVNCERSRSEDIEVIKSIVEQAGVNLIGCIINAVPMSSTKKYRLKDSALGYNYGYGYIDYDYYYNRYKQKYDESADQNTEEKEQD